MARQMASTSRMRLLEAMKASQAGRQLAPVGRSSLTKRMNLSWWGSMSSSARARTVSGGEVALEQGTHTGGDRGRIRFDGQDVGGVEEDIPSAAAGGGDDGEPGEEILDAGKHGAFFFGQTEADPAAVQRPVDRVAIKGLVAPGGFFVEPEGVGKRRPDAGGVGGVGFLAAIPSDQGQARNRGGEGVAFVRSQTGIVNRVPLPHCPGKRAEGPGGDEGVVRDPGGRQVRGLEGLPFGRAVGQKGDPAEREERPQALHQLAFLRQTAGIGVVPGKLDA